MEYKNEKIISWHVGTGLQLPSPTHHTGDFFAPHYINLRDDCQKKILPSGWPGRAGLRLAPRIIELYQIFPFIVNYGTIRMEL